MHDRSAGAPETGKALTRHPVGRATRARYTSPMDKPVVLTDGEIARATTPAKEEVAGRCTYLVNLDDKRLKVDRESYEKVCRRVHREP